MKTTEWYFPVVLFIMLYKVIPKFESVSVTVQMKDTEQFERPFMVATNISFQNSLTFP